MRITIFISFSAVLLMSGALLHDLNGSVRNNSIRPYTGTLDAAALACNGAPTDCGDDDSIIAQNNLPSGGVGSCRSHGLIVQNSQRYGKLTSPLGALQYRLASQISFDNPKRFRISKAPTWSHSAIWNLNGTAIMTSNTPTNSIYHFSFKTGLARQVITSSLEENSTFAPEQLQAIDNHYIAENYQGHLLWLDQEFTIKRQLHLIDSIDSLSFIVKSATNWIAQGEKIVAIGDLKRGEDDWTSALMEFQVNRPGHFETIHIFDIKSSISRQYARLGFPILASAGEKAYALLVEGAPGLYEIGSGIRLLKTFPDGFRSFPKFDSEVNEKTIARVYGTFEGAHMPVALYGKGQFLYLLLRRPSAHAGETTWLLAKIDPQQEKVVHTVKLPTTGHHILLAPGNTEWAIVEKDRVEGMGKQKVQEIVIMPATWPEEGKWQEDPIIETTLLVPAKG